MKKVIILPLLIALGSSLFALDLSFGGGIMTGATFNKMESNPSAIVPSYLDVAMSYTVKDFDIGAFVFADVKYAELSIGFLQQIGTVTDIVGDVTTAGVPSKEFPPDESYRSSLLLFDLLGKYPFTLSEKISVYPALGLMFRLPIAGNKSSDFEHKANWGLGIKAGGGLDFTLTDALFLRCELFVYYELAADKDISAPPPGSSTSYEFKVKNAGYYLQPQLKVAIGYKL
jgi:hypothetical protein